MEKETLKALEVLAQKLGTTAEYLWEILIRQAFVSSVIDLILYAILAVLGVLLYRFHKWCSIKDIGRTESRYYYNDFLTPTVFFLCTIYSILLIVAFCSISTTITGFINPEYWALERILNSIK